jgi:hypothetical protein
MQFLFGGLSGMLATCVVQPLDLVKTRYRSRFRHLPIAALPIDSCSTPLAMRKKRLHNKRADGEEFGGGPFVLNFVDLHKMRL